MLVKNFSLASQIRKKSAKTDNKKALLMRNTHREGFLFGAEDFVPLLFFFGFLLLKLHLFGNFFKIRNAIGNKYIILARNFLQRGGNITVFSENNKSIKPVFNGGAGRLLKAECGHLLFCEIIRRKYHIIHKLTI